MHPIWEVGATIVASAPCPRCTGSSRTSWQRCDRLAQLGEKSLPHPQASFDAARTVSRWRS